MSSRARGAKRAARTRRNNKTTAVKTKSVDCWGGNKFQNATARSTNFPQPEPEPQKPTCSISGCERPVSAKGYCGTHHSRWLRGGDMHARIERHQPRGHECVMDGCKNAVKARRFCEFHYERWRGHKDMRAAKQFTNKGRSCAIAGCVRAAVIVGICRHCYQRRNYYKAKHNDAPPPLKIKSVDDWLARPIGQ